MRKKTVMSALAVAAGALLADSLLAPATAPKVTAATQPLAPLVHTATNPLIATLPVRQALGAPQGELFASVQPPKARRVLVVAPPEPPAPPTMPYRLAGSLAYDGEVSVVLARGDRLYSVHAGHTLDGGYRVESADLDGVTLVYEPLGVRQQVAASSALPGSASRPAVRSGSRYVSAGLR